MVIMEHAVVLGAHLFDQRLVAVEADHLFKAEFRLEADLGDIAVRAADVQPDQPLPSANAFHRVGERFGVVLFGVGRLPLQTSAL